eukprot:2649277-Rhodomonas_salina.1
MALIWQVRQKRSALALFARIRTCRQPKLWRKVAAFCMETNKGAFCHLSDGWRGKLSCLSSQIANSYECSSSWTAYNSIQRCWCRRIYMTGNSARRKEEHDTVAQPHAWPRRGSSEADDADCAVTSAPCKGRQTFLTEMRADAVSRARSDASSAQSGARDSWRARDLLGTLFFAGGEKEQEEEERARRRGAGGAQEEACDDEQDKDNEEEEDEEAQGRKQAQTQEKEEEEAADWVAGPTVGRGGSGLGGCRGM